MEEGGKGKQVALELCWFYVWWGTEQTTYAAYFLNQENCAEFTEFV